MSHEITTLTYAPGVELRAATDQHGETIVCLADLAKGLGIKNVSQLSKRLTDGVCRTYPIVDSLGRTQNATFVTEAGMNLVIWRSDKPEAIRYAEWCAERIAELRRHGITATPEMAERVLNDPDFLIAALTELKAARAEKARIAAELAAAQPKADTWDMICSGVGDYTITDAAKVLARAGIQTGPRRLHAQMRDLGWLYTNQRGKWCAMQTRIDDGCLAERARYYVDDSGVSTLATPQVRVTAKGLDRLRALLGAPQAVLA